MSFSSRAFLPVQILGGLHRVPVGIRATNVRARSACVGVEILTSYSGSGASRVGRACASSLMMPLTGDRRPAVADLLLRSLWPRLVLLFLLLFFLFPQLLLFVLFLVFLATLVSH